MTKKLVLLTLVTMTTLLGALQAEAAEQLGQWYIAPLVAGTYPDGDRRLDDDFNYQLIVGRAVAQNWNIEGWLESGSYDGAVETDLQGVTVGGSRVFFRDNRITPYLMIGTGLLNNDPQGQESKTDMLLTYGLGFLIDFTRNGGVAARAEVRSRMQFANQQTFEDFLVGFGIQIPFGQPRSD